MDGLIAYALAKKAIVTSMGDISTNLTYKGTVASVEDLPTDAAAGDMYGVGTLGLYAYNGTDWGAIGRAGPQGIQGNPGGPGVPGRDGAIQYTAGSGISISDDNIISSTGGGDNSFIITLNYDDEDEPFIDRTADEIRAAIEEEKEAKLNVYGIFYKCSYWDETHLTFSNVDGWREGILYSSIDITLLDDSETKVEITNEDSTFKTPSLAGGVIINNGEYPYEQGGYGYVIPSERYISWGGDTSGKYKSDEFYFMEEAEFFSVNSLVGSYVQYFENGEEHSLNVRAQNIVDYEDIIGIIDDNGHPWITIVVNSVEDFDFSGIYFYKDDESEDTYTTYFAFSSINEIVPFDKRLIPPSEEDDFILEINQSSDPIQLIQTKAEILPILFDGKRLVLLWIGDHTTIKAQCVDWQYSTDWVSQLHLVFTAVAQDGITTIYADDDGEGNMVVKSEYLPSTHFSTIPGSITIANAYSDIVSQTGYGYDSNYSAHLTWNGEIEDRYNVEVEDSGIFVLISDKFSIYNASALEESGGYITLSDETEITLPGNVYVYDDDIITVEDSDYNVKVIIVPQDYKIYNNTYFEHKGIYFNFTDDIYTNYFSFCHQINEQKIDKHLIPEIDNLQAQLNILKSSLTSEIWEFTLDDDTVIYKDIVTMSEFSGSYIPYIEGISYYNSMNEELTPGVDFIDSISYCIGPKLRWSSLSYNNINTNLTDNFHNKQAAFGNGLQNEPETIWSLLLKLQIETNSSYIIPAVNTSLAQDIAERHGIDFWTSSEGTNHPDTRAYVKYESGYAEIDKHQKNISVFVIDNTPK